MNNLSNVSKVKEELIRNIKDCGQSLIDNAEKIVNEYKYHTDLTITCYPCMKDKFPSIVVETSFIPEKIAERYMCK